MGPGPASIDKDGKPWEARLWTESTNVLLFPRHSSNVELTCLVTCVCTRSNEGVLMLCARFLFLWMKPRGRKSKFNDSPATSASCLGFRPVMLMPAGNDVG